MSLQPTTPEEVQTIVREHEKLLPQSGVTKTALSKPHNGATPLDMRGLQGILEYEPNEYTFTAYAGTPLSEIRAALDEHGQYLPFDPLLVAAGATIGGTVAANAGGPGRYRYGGVRDFILGIHFVDGRGQLVRGGGKVVKNAAGFDLPKLMVGSLGRFGILVDVTFKVFPEPRPYVTLQASYASLGPALQAIYALSTAPLDIDILDLEPDPERPAAFNLLIRFGGLEAALPERTTRLQTFLNQKTAVEEITEVADEASMWQKITACKWLPPEHKLFKLPLTPRQIPLLENLFRTVDSPRRYSVAGNVAWLAAPNVAEVDRKLQLLGLTGLMLIGPPGQPYVGVRKGLSLARRVKQALDPHGKFLEV